MKNITVKPDLTIRQAMKQIGISGKRCLVIVDGGNNLFCISFYMDTEDGFVTRVEMPEKLSEEELQLSSLLLNSIFSGKLETDAIKAITKLYAESPAIYRDCIQIITGWQDLKKNGT